MTTVLKFFAIATGCVSALVADQQPSWISAPGPGGSIGIHLNLAGGQTEPVTGKPFSATEVSHSVQTLADGSRAEQTETASFARDETGRIRQDNGKMIVLYDPKTHLYSVLDSASKTYYETKAFSVSISGNRVMTWSYQSNNNTSVPVLTVQAPETHEAELPGQMISGLWAKGSRITTVIPAGKFGNQRDLQVVDERWYSDDMKILLKTSNSDPRFGTTTYELTNLTPGPPDPALFQIPAGYRQLHDGRLHLN
jgi:hypothetical protein